MAFLLASIIEELGPPEMSVPSPIRNPFSNARRNGKTASEKKKFDNGQWAIPAPCSLITSISFSEIKFACANIVDRFNNP